MARNSRKVILAADFSMNAFSKQIVIFVVVMSAVAGAGWFGRKAYKRVTERKLVAEASHYLKTNDFRNAELCLRRAMQINPMSVRVAQATAEMLEAAGVPAALEWRIRVAQLQPANITNRFLWAESALRISDLKSAAEALDGVKGAPRSTSTHLKLSGALAWALHKNDEAEKFYCEAHQVEPGNLIVVLNLNTVHLASTNPAVAQAARASLEQMTTNASYRLSALEHLKQDAVARRAVPDALRYAKRLAAEPMARDADKIDYLQILRVTTNADFQPYLAFLKQEATNSPVGVFALGRWIAMAEGPTNALNWLQIIPLQVRLNQPVPLLVADCKIALKDWAGLLDLVEKKPWGEADFYRLALESLAQRSLGEPYASQTAWRDALRRSKHRLERLSRLAQATAAWNWKTENIELLHEITEQFPKEKWAANSLMAQLYSVGNTRDLTAFVSKMYSDDPSNVRLKNNLANLFLLRKSDLPKAYRLAREAYDSSPRDPFFTSTYAYSLLLQNKADEAVKVLSDLKPEYLEIPSIAAYYGVVQASSGHRGIARTALQRADASPLLPEEKEIVHLAMSGLSASE